jgi:hypothetical protein
MKRFSIVSTLMIAAAFSSVSHAEDMPSAPAATQAEPVAAVETAPAVPETVVPSPTIPAPADVETIEAQDATLVDNLEFISGEVSELDEPGKSVSVRLYGETEDAASDKVLKVTVDENTDITDGEQDRDLKSLATGTEVDVEYDPATNKATYIFVY